MPPSVTAARLPSHSPAGSCATDSVPTRKLNGAYNADGGGPIEPNSACGTGPTAIGSSELGTSCNTICPLASRNVMPNGARVMTARAPPGVATVI